MDGDSRKNPMIFVDVWKMQFPRTHTVNPEISSSWFFFLFTVKPRRDWKFTGRFTVFDTNSPAGTRRVFRKTGFYTKSWRLERNQTIFRLITFGSLPLSLFLSLYRLTVDFFRFTFANEKQKQPRASWTRKIHPRRFSRKMTSE